MREISQCGIRWANLNVLVQLLSSTDKVVVFQIKKNILDFLRLTVLLIWSSFLHIRLECASAGMIVFKSPSLIIIFPPSWTCQNVIMNFENHENVTIHAKRSKHTFHTSGSHRIINCTLVLLMLQHFSFDFISKNFLRRDPK